MIETSSLNLWLEGMELSEQIIAGLQLRGEDLLTREQMHALLPFDIE